MKKEFWSTIAVIILLSGFVAAYCYFQHEEPPSEAQAVNAPDVASTLPETKPDTRQVLNLPEQQIELPPLESSDHFMALALENLLSNRALMDIFVNDDLINNIVVTIDNLPRKQTTMRVMPIKKAPGKFIPMQSEGMTVISPNNSERYSKYIAFAETVNPQQLVKLYIQLYPLFQEKYEALGYPNQYFNDRLMIVLDHLLATPTLTKPVALIQPKFFYLYADPDLESRSTGQRILMRLGNQNQQIVQAKLQAIKEVLLQNMHEQRIQINNKN